jgi:hypothetical protein
LNLKTAKVDVVPAQRHRCRPQHPRGDPTSSCPRHAVGCGGL